MLHIALCDDEADHRQLTHELLNTYFADRGVAAKIWRFPDGQSLLNAVLDNPFDLYLLDILFSMYGDGLVLADSHGIPLDTEVSR